MRIVPRTQYDKNRGEQIEQWLAGCFGAIITTLPSFVVLPLWFAFVHNYQIVDDDGTEDNVACGMICFIAGILVWLAAALLSALLTPHSN